MEEERKKWKKRLKTKKRLGKRRNTRKGDEDLVKGKRNDNISRRKKLGERERGQVLKSILFFKSLLFSIER